MSTPDPRRFESGGVRRPLPAYEFEPGTDPGRVQPFESLYRDPARSPHAHRPTARHFEPWLTAPEDPSADDTFHWLYRPEPDAATGDEPASSPTGASVTSAEPRPEGPGVLPEAGSPSLMEDSPELPERRDTLPLLLALGVTLVVLVTAAVLVF
jgi:hypothetical protein